MTAQLPLHISFCSIGGRLIFLDTRRDRYFMLSAADADLFREAIASSQVGLAVRQRLVAAGALAAAGEAGRPVVAPNVQIPALSLLDSAAPRSAPPVAAVIEVGLRLLVVRRKLQRGGFGTLVARMLAGKARLHAWAGSDGAVAEHAQRFRAARRFAPTEPNCLLDTLALAGFLTSRRVQTTFVVGVKLDPFAAHCWLQDTSQIFNDTYENATAFTPILVI